jgi:hypothetical protein
MKLEPRQVSVKKDSLQGVYHIKENFTIHIYTYVKKKISCIRVLNFL